MKRTGELRDALGAPTALGDEEDRTPGQQLQDLGVIERTEIVWYRPDYRKGGPLPEGTISVNTAGITLSKEVYTRLMAAGPKISVGIIKVRGKNRLALKPGKTGFKVTVTSKGSHRYGTKKLANWLMEHGIENGLYEVKEVKGGWLAVPV